jgi:hypothetical protein
MSDRALVVIVFVVNYGAIIGYAAYLHLRRRRAEG